MSSLRLPRQELTFEQLVTLGRAAIPAVAPGWTDHNVHDPGITLMELVAWIADAQMYSIGRVRRDERLAYARLLGVEPRGPLPAAGLVWPHAGSDATAPPPTWPEGRVLPAGAALVNDRPGTPQFFTSRPITLTGARLARLETRVGDTPVRDWTTVNSRDGATFLPFGDPPVEDERLVLVLRVQPDDAGKVTGDLSLGFEIVNQGSAPAGTAVGAGPRIVASLHDDSGQRRLRVFDTTGGLLKSGVIVVRLDRPLRTADGTFEISLRSATGGLLRAPRVQRVALNVLPVTQMRQIDSENGTLLPALPGQVHELTHSGLLFPHEDGAFAVEAFEDGTWQPWTVVNDLDESGPNERHVRVDYSTGTIHFGNGINGHVPSVETSIRVTYRVCDGSRGNLARGIQWSVAGVPGVFGVNSQVMRGGSEAQGLNDLRALARAHFQSSRPIVTAADLVSAALSLADLGVERATEVPPRPGSASVRGARTLIVVGHHEGQGAAAVETPELLEEVRARLAPRLPAGQRLMVRGPAYVPVRVLATLRTARNANPKEVEAAAVAALRTRLAVVAPAGSSEWPFGRDLTATTVKGWLRVVEGVARVVNVELRTPASAGTPDVELGPADLPRFEFAAGDLTVEREPLRGSQ